MNKILPFIIFLSIFLTLYGLLHFYFYTKIVKALDMTGILHLLLVIVLILMLFSPITTNMLSGTEYFRLTKILSYICYIWMGALFLFFSLNLLIDIYRLIVHISARLVSYDAIRYLPGYKITFIATFLIIACIVIYGMFEAGNIGVERVEIKTAKLPAHISRFRVVQVADTHFSVVNNSKLARKLANIIADLRPDLLVSTGDLIDRGLQNKEKVASTFREIQVPYGKYAVAGNHEFISGINAAVEFIESAGFKMLRNESVTIGDFLGIAGIDDRDAKRFGDATIPPETRVLEALDPDHLLIFLKHQPRINSDSIGKFDIQLSGHTHDGQIFPFTLIVSIFYPYMKGLFTVGNDSYLYVSRGAGTWGPPFRFLTFPEVTAIDFVRKEWKENTEH